MRKTNHILHGALTLVTVGVWGLGWGMIALRNWSYNESHGYNDLSKNEEPVPANFVESTVRYPSHSQLSSVAIVPDGNLNEVVAHRIATQKAQPLSKLVNELGLEGEVTIPATRGTYLPKAPIKKKEKSVFGEEIKREFVLDQELTKMFQDMGIKDPGDMQKIIDASLADTTTALPRNRLLLSFGNYARKLISDNSLDVTIKTDDPGLN